MEYWLVLSSGVQKNPYIQPSCQRDLGNENLLRQAEWTREGAGRRDAGRGEK